MSERPAIVVIDDEPAALAAMLDALTRRFGGDYRIVPYLSAVTAIDAVSEMKKTGDEIALVIADQWMPEMTGNDFLSRIRTIEPTAKRALLVAWGDQKASETVLNGCLLGNLDNYLYKPWTPAEVHLYPFVSEFLAEWTQVHRPGMEVIHLVGSENSARSQEIRELLDRNAIPYGFHDVSSPAALDLLEKYGAKRDDRPMIFLLDGSTLTDPTDAQIMDALGENPTESTWDVAIIGGGPAGLASAVYAGSEGLRTIVIERHMIGGQAGASSLIRNYLGFPRGISGGELTQRAYQQAWLFGAKFVFSREVTGIRGDGPRKILTLSDGREIIARAAIVATGATYNRLAVPDIERFEGRSIFYTTFAGTRLAGGFDVVVVGGGNSAGQAAMHLAVYSRKVTLIVRADSLERGMSDYLVQQIAHAPNIDVRLNSEVAGVYGDDLLDRVSIRENITGAVETIPARLAVVLIGATPHTDWLDGVVQREKKGFIMTGSYLEPDAWPSQRRPLSYETSMPGVFAAGDVRYGSTKRVATSVGEGAGAVQNIHEYLAASRESEQLVSS